MAFHNVPPNGFPDLPDVEELEAVVKDVTTLKTSVSGLSEDVSDLEEQKANQITIAPAFNAETTYEVGDLVYYNGLSYRCTNEHTGEWDADDFTGTTIENELASLKSGLTNKVGIASATNLNDEKSIGVRTFAYNTPNNPSNHSGSMLGLFQSDSYGLQLAQCSSETEAYVRFYNTDTWSSWDKIVKNSDLTNILNFVITGTPDSSPFAESASGVTFAIKLGGTTLGYLTIRPKNYLGAQNKPIAMELYDASWGLVWLVLRDAT